MMRMMLYEAAQSMLVRSAKWSWLKAWAPGPATPRTWATTPSALNMPPILRLPLKRFAKGGQCGLAVTSRSYLYGVRRTNRRSTFHK